MAIYRATISFPLDGVLPRDNVTITPHYMGDDAQGLANALKSNLIAFSQVTTKPFKISVYDAQKPAPNFPLATAEQTGTSPSSSNPRELALCLSYYATFNRPRYRGRLYIPLHFVGGTAFLRPSGAQITAALAWRTALAAGLPSGHVMCVYSRASNSAGPVSDFWVDDEWDVMRSRGLKSTTRQTAKLP
jgi:hypothetical protein